MGAAVKGTSAAVSGSSPLSAATYNSRRHFWQTLVEQTLYVQSEEQVKGEERGKWIVIERIEQMNMKTDPRGFFAHELQIRSQFKKKKLLCGQYGKWRREGG